MCAILAREEQLCPRRAALLVVRPLHLVEHEHLPRAGSHLDGAAEDRRALVDALLAGDEADPLVAQLRRRAVGAPPGRAFAAARRRRLSLARRGRRARRASCRSSSARGARRRSPARCDAVAAGSRSGPRRASPRRACTRPSRGRGVRPAKGAAAGESVDFVPLGNRSLRVADYRPAWVFATTCQARRHVRHGRVSAWWVTPVESPHIAYAHPGIARRTADRGARHEDMSTPAARGCGDKVDAFRDVPRRGRGSSGGNPTSADRRFASKDQIFR